MMPFITLSHLDDHNRITLNALPEHEDCQREFINACYVDVKKSQSLHDM